MSTPASQAQALLQQGRIREAEQAFARLLESEPVQLEALNVLCLAALRDGQPARALELATRAASAAPEDPLSLYHLGHARQANGDAAAAIDAWRAAVRHRAGFHVARLHLGLALHAAGDPLGTVQLARALQDAQRAGRWVDAASTPTTQRPLVERAVNLVRGGRRAAYLQLLEPLTAEFGAAELGRVRQCIAIHLQEQAPVYPDARQQPTFLFLPGLPTAPYFDPAMLPWIPALEARSAEIRAELLQILPASQHSERVFGDAALERANLRGTHGAEPGWTGFYFYRHGARREDNCRSCPVTAAALDALPLSHVRHHGPEVLFSVYTPGTHLLPHRGVTNTRIVGHLPLIIPEDCALNVGGERHDWREGRVVVFDDTYEHESWNRSAQLRVVLIFDLWNPYLTTVERLAVQRLVEAIGDFNQATAAA